MAKPLGDSVVVEPPRVEDKPRQFTIGMRKWIPSKTIGGAISKMLAEVKKILVGEGIGDLGRPFFRFHCINMGTEFDLEVGYLVDSEIRSRGGLIANSFPAASYATLKYAGKNRGYQGNKALIEWARSNGHQMDRWDTERGDTFACRYEVYISDISAELDHNKWLKEVAIKLQ